MSEPQRLGEILPDAMQDIRRRMELNRQKKVLSAVSEYYQRRNRTKRPVFLRYKKRKLIARLDNTGNLQQRADEFACIIKNAILKSA